MLPEIVLKDSPVGPTLSTAYSDIDADTGKPPVATERVKLELIAWEPVDGIPKGKCKIVILVTHEKSQISTLVEEPDNSKYCSVVNKHTLLPKEPDCGFNTTSAFEEENVYLTKLALTANDDDTANDAV